ncbi:MAG: polymer-forming cytoskeletal protein [Candidatus Doudnabacteria bacterium]|nr:polymer-forming cytoskeletal protein [Candidatus Doudnabacteria bacterium]
MARKEDYQTNSAPETIVGATVKIEGDLASEGDIRVDGLVTGKIKTSKNLFVGSMAKIEADVEAANAMIAGHVKGDLKIKETLNVQETGKIDGNISCERLAIAEGAHFSGACTMPDKAAELGQPLPEEE